MAPPQAAVRVNTTVNERQLKDAGADKDRRGDDDELGDGEEFWVTDALQASAFTFEKSSKKLRQKMWYKKMRLYAVAFGVVALLSLALSMMICNPDFSRCGAGDDKK